jgi:hypothetical protein
MASHFTQKIHLDAAGNVTVTTNPPKQRFEAGDMVTLVSDRDSTTIKYTTTSPFAEIPAKQVTPVGRSSGPHRIIETRKQSNHFDCGEQKAGEFVRWSGGGGTPSGGGQGL